MFSYTTKKFHWPTFVSSFSAVNLVYYVDKTGSGACYIFGCVLTWLPVLRVTDRVNVVAYYRHTCFLFTPSFFDTTSPLNHRMFPNVNILYSKTNKMDKIVIRYSPYPSYARNHPHQKNSETQKKLTKNFLVLGDKAPHTKGDAQHIHRTF